MAKMTFVRRIRILPVIFLLAWGCQNHIARPPEAILTPVVISPEAAATPTATPSPVPIALLPTTQTEWRLEKTVRAALIRDDLIFVSEPPTYTAAFDLNLGALAWQRDDLPLSLPMAADSEHLYVVSEGSIVALNGATGEVEWQISIPTGDVGHELVVVEEERMVLYSNIPWVTGEEGSVLYALDAHDGDVLWQVELPAPLDPYRPVDSQQRHSAIAYDGGQVYLRLVIRPACCFAILALTAQGGTRLWEFAFGIEQWPGESPSFGADTLVLDDNFVYVPSYFGPLYIVLRLNGTLYGSTRSTEWRTSLMRVGDSIVWRSPYNKIERFDLSEGVSWSTSVAEDIPFAPQIVTLNDLLLVETTTYSSEKIHIAVLNLTSGEQMGTIAVGDSGRSNVLLTMGACSGYLCLVTMTHIYQIQLGSLS